jgi:Flp pilus assembly protein TadB
MDKKAIPFLVVLVLAISLFFIALEWVLQNPWIWIIFGVVVAIGITLYIVIYLRSRPKPPTDDYTR